MDELDGQMTRKHFYVLVNLTDEVLGIGHSDMPDTRDCSPARKCYFSDIDFKFPIGMFRYRRSGSKTDWVVIFRVPRGASTSNSDFIQTIANTSREAPEHLSRRQTSDAIASIRSIVGANSRLARELLATILPNGTSHIFCDTNSEKDFVRELSTHIQNSDSIHNNEDFFTDMRKFNFHGNTYETNFSVFWSAAARVIDMDTGTGAHQRRHTEVYE